MSYPVPRPTTIDYVQVLTTLNLNLVDNIYFLFSHLYSEVDVLLYFSLLVEELRKTLIAIWEGGKSAISPESLLHVIWKLVPRFR